MQRYVAVVWNDKDAAAALTAAGLERFYRENTHAWSCALRVAGLVVFVAPDVRPAMTFHVPGHSGGVILGSVFGERVEQEAAQILATGGRCLPDRCWGSYVALLSDGARNQCHVLRDPSGRMPCFRWQHSGCSIFFADLADVTRLARSRNSINWQFVIAFLLYDELCNRDTGLHKMSEILAGERLTITDSVEERELFWNPAEVCRRGFIEDGREAQEQLRITTQRVIEAWGRRCPRILHHLSGGFDSAVVLGCAQDAGLAPAITCVNRFSERPGEDERLFARAVAARAGVDLIECKWGTGGKGLESLHQVPLSPRPSVQMLSILESETLNELAQRYRAEAQWTGQGGDHLFFQMKTNLGAADYLRAHGVNVGLTSAIADAARLTRESYWSVVGSAIRADVFGRSGVRRPVAVSPFVSSEVAAAITPDYLVHPWSVCAANLPAGKQFQIGLLASLANRVNPLARLDIAPEVHPLISQPLIELSLRIPTYLLLRGGRSRGLAREAFRDFVPTHICERETKGGTTIHLTTLLRQNLPFIRDALLDGTLVRERLIDRTRLEPYLLKGHPLRPGELSPLLACLTAELWLTRTW